MRRTEFWTYVEREFGRSEGQTITRDVVLTELDDRTASEALSIGVEPRDVWHALCRQFDVPKSRWHSPDKVTISRHAD